MMKRMAVMLMIVMVMAGCLSSAESPSESENSDWSPQIEMTTILTNSITCCRWVRAIPPIWR